MTVALTGAVGKERQLMAELVRSADLHACVHGGLINSASPAPFPTMLAGVNSSISAFLPLLDKYPDGIPWQPTNTALSNWADMLLYENGVREVARRLLKAEMYGLTKSRVVAADHIEITQLYDELERYDRIDNAWLLKHRRSQFQEESEDIKAELEGWSKRRVNSYVKVFKKHFIEYESDWDLLTLYRREAKLELMEAAETEALPLTSIIGPLTFGEWLDQAAAAIARARLHVSFSKQLMIKRRGKLNLRNLLTTPARHEDLLAVWREQGAHAHHASKVFNAFRLDAVASRRYETEFDIPLPYYVAFGKHFDLLTHFGYLQNPTAFLTEHLRTHYWRDWCRTVEGREAAFISDIRGSLSGADHLHCKSKVLIRGSNTPGTTDIDAAVFERSSTTLFLIQLKWPDIVGHGLKQRASKLTNLASANEWVHRCHEWANSMSRGVLWSRFFTSTPPESETFDIELVVIARYMTRFTNPPRFDERAIWTSWATRLRALHEAGAESCALKSALSRIHSWRPPERIHEPLVDRHELSGLRIDFIS